MSSLRPLAVLSILSAIAGCRSWEFDVPEIQANYQYRHVGACNAWATSPVTGYQYCASPPFFADVPPITVATGPAFASLKEGPTDTEALRAHGERVYTAVCAGCHQSEGQGMGDSFPPLAGSGAFYGDPAQHAGIIVRGLSGAITVQGKAYNGSMPPQGAQLTDYDIAAVATYERTSWGNADGPVLPEIVASVR